MHRYCIGALVTTLSGMQMFPQLHDLVRMVQIIQQQQHLLSEKNYYFKQVLMKTQQLPKKNIF
jgi:hypothetical protein